MDELTINSELENRVVLWVTGDQYPWTALPYDTVPYLPRIGETIETPPIRQS